VVVVVDGDVFVDSVCAGDPSGVVFVVFSGECELVELVGGD